MRSRRRDPQRRAMACAWIFLLAASCSRTQASAPLPPQTAQFGAYHVSLSRSWWSNQSESAGPGIRAQNDAVSQKVPFRLEFAAAYSGRLQEFLLVSRLRMKDDRGIDAGTITNYLEGILRKPRPEAPPPLAFLPRPEGATWIIRFSSGSNEVYKLIAWHVDEPDALMLDMVSPRASHQEASLAEYSAVLEQRF
ncbi:MAG: hypothetical protein J0L75_08390 [Spirochaetes bacterium]|nr:hypothetical protein [Spirochaetota bacterium]